MTLRAPELHFDPCDELAALCKAGGDPLRLNVLRALSNDSFGVLELAQIFAIGQSGMSHHLKVLALAGLVATRREGNAIFYRRALPTGRLVCDLNPERADTAFLAAARAAGHRTLGGLPMVARQGAAGFEAWTGERAPLDVMIAALEARVAAG